MKHPTIGQLLVTALLALTATGFKITPQAGGAAVARRYAVRLHSIRRSIRAIC